jgi:hypothetical protein
VVEGRSAHAGDAGRGAVDHGIIVVAVALVGAVGGAGDLVGIVVAEGAGGGLPSRKVSSARRPEKVCVSEVRSLREL